jgi:internalin A
MRTKKFSFNDSIGAVHVDPRFVAEGLAYAERKSCSYLRITASDDVQYWQGKTCNLDLTPLSGNESIRKLSIDDDVNISNANIDALYSLKNLRELWFSNRKINPDFSRLPWLEGLSMDYYGTPIGMSSLKKLRSLYIRSLKTKDCTLLGGLDSLEKLRLDRGSVETLSGTEMLKSLAKVNISYFHKLDDISALAKLKSLTSLHVEKCTGVTDYSFLSGNASMEELFISDLDSLSFVPDMKRLRKLHFWNLKDGDLSPVLQAKSLKVVWFSDKRYYSHRRAEIDALLKQPDRGRSVAPPVIAHAPRFSLPNTGEVAFPANAEGHWDSSLPFDGREVSVTFDIDGNEMTATLLARVRPFLSDADRFDRLALEAIRADFEKANDSTSRLYLSGHVDALDATERKHYFGVSRPAAIGVDQLLAALRLVRIGLCPDGERHSQERKSRSRVVAIFDYSIGATDNLLVVKFGLAGKIVGLAIES